MGLVSCLYQLRLKLPVDFDLHAHGNEREAALAHLKILSENDVVVYDHGYWSFEMLHAHAARGLHPVFRIKRKAGGTFDAFINSQWTDAVVEVAPGSKALRKLRRKHPGGTFGPHRLRLGEITPPAGPSSSWAPRCSTGRSTASKTCPTSIMGAGGSKNCTRSPNS